MGHRNGNPNFALKHLVVSQMDLQMSDLLFITKKWFDPLARNGM
jgi:hypothetical protein